MPIPRNLPHNFFFVVVVGGQKVSLYWGWSSKQESLLSGIPNLFSSHFTPPFFSLLNWKLAMPKLDRTLEILKGEGTGGRNGE